MPERFWNMPGAHAGGTLVTIVLLPWRPKLASVKGEAVTQAAA
jgi:hypothetical protein